MTFVDGIFANDTAGNSSAQEVGFKLGVHSPQALQIILMICVYLFVNPACKYTGKFELQA